MYFETSECNEILWHIVCFDYLRAIAKLIPVVSASFSLSDMLTWAKKQLWSRPVKV